MKRMIVTMAALGLGCGLGAAQAEPAWALAADESRVAYGSIKKSTVGEVNHFTAVTGEVSGDGAVVISIDVTSVSTGIDIRDERMVAHVFDAAAPTATLSAQIDLAALEGLAPGATTTMDIEGVLTLSGHSIDIETTMFIARLAEDRALVSTDAMIMVPTGDIGVNAGIDKLMEIAKLPAITRVAPVTLRLVFAKTGGEAAVTAATTTAAVAPGGDPEKGKKVFKKCKACHKIKKAKHGVGPHLIGVIGRAAGSAEGYKYSKVMAGAGLTWTAENLAAYLASPKKFLPKNKMTFRGLKKPADIENVIAYMATFTP